MPAPYGFNPYSSYTYPTSATVPQTTIQPTVQAYTPSYLAGYLPGRVVSTIDEVTAQEVPMNGDRSVFPTRDGNAIYVKQWNSDGTIRTIRYVLEEGHEPKSLDVSDRLDGIERRLSKLENRKKNYDRNRGGSSSYHASYSSGNNVEEAEVIDND